MHHQKPCPETATQSAPSGSIPHGGNFDMQRKSFAAAQEFCAPCFAQSGFRAQTDTAAE